MKEVSKKCTNCSACYLLCPTNAIKENVINGFAVAVIDEKKCINCGLCTKVCPNLNVYNKNINTEIKLVRLKNQKKLSESTSGGIFGEIARYVLNQKGIVYGAAFNNDFSVSHKRIDNFNELNIILKTKYVQSKIAIFENAKKDLDNEKLVLFSGTACQITGLKKYLSKDYNNLLTIDLICKGIPSGIVWQKYLEELKLKNQSEIEEIDFRYYNRKEKSKNFFIKFKNGKILNEELYNNVYGKSFLLNMIHNESCYECKFKNFKNQSDITIGDAWGYTNAEYDKISLAIFNTSKGIELFNKVKKQFIIFDDFDFKNMLLNNYPILHSSIKHIIRDNLLARINKSKDIATLIDSKSSIEQCLDYSPENVGILNFHYENYNYGANLVAYSLSHIIKRMGYNPYIINLDPTMELNSIERYRTFEFLNFRQNQLRLTVKFDSNDELNILNKYFDNFVVGSDQVWRKTITQNNILKYFFDFVSWDKSVISYAASFGTEEFEGNNLEITAAKKLLKKFNAISVREQSGVDICHNVFDKEAALVLDPTILLSVEDYDKLIENKIPEHGYIAYYCLFDQEKEFLKKLSSLFPNKKLLNIKGYIENINITNESIFVYNSIGTWLSGIKNCDFVVTDSYHGVLFSILYNKEFICLGKSSVSKSRFYNVSKILNGGISKRMFNTLDEINLISDLSKLNYITINKNLEKYKNISLNFLESNLIKKKKYTQEELFDIINESEDIINNIEKEKETIFKNNEKLTEQNNNLLTKCELLELDNIKLNRLLTNAEIKISNIIYSKSWRITAPLRFIVFKLNKK